MEHTLHKNHGNVGNGNAKKEVTNDAQLYIRCQSEFKNALVKKAQSKEMKLSDWIIEVLKKELRK
ncbi:hypothetical protein [Providencia burhodogranariea]|uniref:Uncharacterized protein n=1 Tax=Providencia burhodogranariea DSM 19968 TaxID=1141662 RepID=K8X176_9GAMM|nr:hypothetical protein OOA_08277 [Providencia burhodogranariea DSM 19968]